MYIWASWLQEQEEIWIQHDSAASPPESDNNAPPSPTVEAEASPMEGTRATADPVEQQLVSSWLRLHADICPCPVS